MDTDVFTQASFCFLDQVQFKSCFRFLYFPSNTDVSYSSRWSAGLLFQTYEMVGDKELDWYGSCRLLCDGHAGWGAASHQRKAAGSLLYSIKLVVECWSHNPDYSGVFATGNHSCLPCHYSEMSLFPWPVGVMSSLFILSLQLLLYIHEHDLSILL